MGDTLQASMSTEEAHPVFSLYLPRILPGTSGALYMHEPARGLFIASAEWGEARPAVGAFKAENCWALRRGRMHVVGPSILALPCDHASTKDGGESLCVPITAIGRTIGLFHVVGTTEETRALALSVADRVGLALSNLVLRSDLRQLSIHDPLTGLFNRRYMEEALEIETRRAERKGSGIGVIMIDIDHFKSFNDGFGHAAGDDMLRSLGGMILAHLRAGDIACRYGGEEFVLILPEAGVEVAAARAEDLRLRVKTLEVQSGEQRLGSVSISLGVAVFPRHGKSRDELLAAVDAALYQAKDSGRDRVVVAGG
jgi:diguanylate cyclase (GGDEF)-like protein